MVIISFRCVIGIYESISGSNTWVPYLHVTPIGRHGSWDLDREDARNTFKSIDLFCRYQSFDIWLIKCKITTEINVIIECVLRRLAYYDWIVIHNAHLFVHA